MAKTSEIARASRLKRKLLNALAAGVAPKFPTRVYNLCRVCGRRHGYLRQFEMCRICFREHANRGEIMGVRKSSW